MLQGKEVPEAVDFEPAAKTPRSSRVLRLLVVGALLAAAVTLLVVFGIKIRVATASAVKQRTLELAVPVVAVIQPRLGDPKNEIVLPGNIQAFVDAPIYARATGYLKHWYADIGTRVKAGQVLADIEAPDLDQQVQQARASLHQSQAALDQAQANYQQGKSNEELARVTAERWKNLAARGVVSKQENDQYQSQYQSQIANLLALEKAIAAAKSNVASAEANLARLQELKGYETVKAPFDGVITVRNTDVGALINGGNGAPNQELFHIAAINRLRVFVNVPQDSSRGATPGMSADLTLTEFPGRRFRGVLARTAEAIDPATRTLLTEIDIDNSSGELRPGSYTEVHLKLPSSARALLLPVSAVLFRSEGLQVGVLRANRVQLVPVTLGKDFGTEVEITSGISPTDRIVSNPPDSLTSGTEVRVVQTQQP